MDIFLVVTDNNYTNYLYKSVTGDPTSFERIDTSNYNGLYNVNPNQQQYYNNPFSTNIIGGNLFTFSRGNRDKLTTAAVRSRYSLDGGWTWQDIFNNLTGSYPPFDPGLLGYKDKHVVETQNYYFTGYLGNRKTAIVRIPKTSLVAPSSGYTFQAVEIPGTLYADSHSVGFAGVYDGDVYAFGGNNRLVKSTDEGATFSLVADFPGSPFSVIHPHSGMRDFKGNPMMAGDNEILYSPNGGATWNQTSISTFTKAVSVNDSAAFAYEVDGHFWRSTDGIDFSNWNIISIDGTLITLNGRVVNAFSAFNKHYVVISRDYSLRDFKLCYSDGTNAFHTCSIDAPWPTNALIAYTCANFL